MVAVTLTSGARPPRAVSKSWLLQGFDVRATPMAYAGLELDEYDEGSSSAAGNVSQVHGKTFPVFGGWYRGGRLRALAGSPHRQPTRCEALTIATRHSASAKKRR